MRSLCDLRRYWFQRAKFLQPFRRDLARLETVQPDQVRAGQRVHRRVRVHDVDDSQLAALADRSHKPASCPHQVPAEVEAEICELRREHPGWGPRRIAHQLERMGIEPLPSRSAIYRCLRRHHLVELRRRRRRRDEYRRWERERPMQLWQMDVMGGVMLETTPS